MNISKITYNYANQNNYSIRKMDKNVSFCGGKTVVAEKVKENSGCALNILLAVAAIPLALLSTIFTNKNDEIERMTVAIQDEYAGHLGNFKHFQDEANDMNKLLDKYSKNEEYSQFVKEAISFLRTNFEQNQYEYDRLKPFNGSNELESQIKWIRFMNTIKNAAKAAIAKNYKDVDIEKLNKDIQLSRKIMQNQ